MTKRWILSAALFLAAYLGSYVWFRQSRVEVWEKDGKAYVIFPADGKAAYYLYRPLTYLDGMLTGMRFHIGPHH